MDARTVRSRFPALAAPLAFLDNAGGSQLPDTVIAAVHDYMVHRFVQVGADYAASTEATATVAAAHRVAELLVNAGEAGKVALGSSTSALVAMLADCYARAPRVGRDEIVVCEEGHEANVGPWLRLEDRGYTVKVWRFDREAETCRFEELEGLVTERTRIVAGIHVSNLLGRIEDIPGLCRIAHAKGARVVVDGVAFAPHRAMDVQALGADWYVYSHYKIYGPHLAALFGTHAALAEIEGPNHFFIDARDVPCKLELGGVLHEGCAGILGLQPYLAFLAGAAPDRPLERAIVERAFEVMAALEEPLQRRLISYLASRDDVRLVGPATADAARVPTLSFVHASKSSAAIARQANAAGLGIRFGHFYAYRLCRALGLDPEDGVVRTSLVHYNSAEEVERLIALFDRIL